MNLSLCIPVNHPIGIGLLHTVHALGFTQVRFDLHTDDHDVMRTQLAEWRIVTELQPIILVAGGHMTRSTGDPWTDTGLYAHVNDLCIKLRDLELFDREIPVVIEIGNEPDLAKPYWDSHPERLGRVFSRCAEIVRTYDNRVTVLSPSISNLNDRGLSYLRRMSPYLPPGPIAVHRYPASLSPIDAHDGFDSRDQETAAVRELVGDRPLWVTESGCAEWVSEDRRITRDRSADYMEADLRHWHTQGAHSVSIYQLNDGRYAFEGSYDEKRLASYGLRTVSGEWKPLAERIERLAVEFSYI